MRILELAAKAANKLLLFVVAAFSLVLFLFSLYVLYDVFYTEKNAFVSYELLQYRPSVNKTDDTENGFEELLKLNPDTVGWLEIYDTNICYPIVQGNDDLEYAGKDIYGYHSLTGSIYLSSDNGSNFDDWYNLIYGHHMENGAMFGDIDKYRDKDFFYSHQKGILQTIDGNYDLTITACVLTDSYEDVIYSVSSRDQSNYSELHDYIRDNSVLLDENNILPELNDTNKLLAFSTCEGASTNGRLVLFADAEKINGPVERPVQEAKEPPGLLQAAGHFSDESHWAFLNLVCVLLTFLIFMPLLFLRRKYRQMRYARRKSEQINKLLEKGAQALPEETGEVFSRYRSRLRSFFRRMCLGIAAELLLTASAVIMFLLTEQITKPMVMKDKWTGPMLIIAYTALLTDFVTFRFRGRRLSPEEETLLEESSESTG